MLPSIYTFQSYEECMYTNYEQLGAPKVRGRPDHRPPGWLATALVGKSSHGPSVLQPPVTAPALLRTTPTPRAAQNPAVMEEMAGGLPPSVYNICKKTTKLAGPCASKFQ